jgi:uncharacterized repeat protein (TIGR03803 family)
MPNKNSTSNRILNQVLMVSVAVLLIMASQAYSQTYTDLFDFNSSYGDYSRNPELLAQGADGLLYGTASYGGLYGQGTLFAATPQGELTVLFNFGPTIGSVPYSGLTLGRDNNLYGTVGYASTGAQGVIFRASHKGDVTAVYILGSGDGAIPNAPPIQAADGNFYGLTAAGGVDGTAYKMTPSGVYTVLGIIPGVSVAPLMQAADGNFYAGTYYGDPSMGCPTAGCIFKVTSQGAISVVYKFDGTHGSSAYPGLVQGNDGLLYGNTVSGGKYGSGVIFKMTTSGKLVVLHNFPDPSVPGDGAGPVSGLILASDGNFYGVTTGGGNSGAGAIFKIDSTGTYSLLYSFDSTQGANPWPTPMQHTNGKIYGLTYAGGAYGAGVLYSFDNGLPAFVNPVSRMGIVGTNIEILGQGFTGAVDVSFNGVPATFLVKSDTLIRATVPVGATSGFVTVTTSTGLLSSNFKFIVKP